MFWKRHLCPLQVFQTFACDDYPEIGTRYLRADGRIECDTPKHTGYMVYAGIMIALCELCEIMTYNPDVRLRHAPMKCTVGVVPPSKLVVQKKCVRP